MPPILLAERLPSHGSPVLALPPFGPSCYSRPPTEQEGHMAEPDKLEAVRLALEKLGEVPAEAISRYVERAFGLTIPVSTVSVLRATLREREQLERARRAAKEA